MKIDSNVMQINKPAILFIITSLLLISCTQSRKTEIEIALSENGVTVANKLVIDSVSINNNKLSLTILDTNRNFNIGFSQLLCTYYLYNIRDEISAFDSVTLRHTYINCKLRYTLKFDAEDVNTYLSNSRTFMKYRIVDSMVNFLLTELPRKDYCDIDDEIQRNNNYFNDYNYHKNLADMVLNCVLNCDTLSSDYRAMMICAIYAYGTQQPKKLELFNLISNNCRGTDISSIDTPSFSFNAVYLDSIMNTRNK